MQEGYLSAFKLLTSSRAAVGDAVEGAVRSPGGEQEAHAGNLELRSKN